MSPSSRQEPIIIGSHHKTGTHLLCALLGAVEARRWLPGPRVLATREERKLPLSQILNRCQIPMKCYYNAWFEHEVDVPKDSIRFLHFLRHPVKWVRSAYLYHKAGGCAEPGYWPRWRVFRAVGRYVSYCEILNGVADERGLLIEAIRCFPEIIGTARAAASSNHLLNRVQVSLEQFYDDFGSGVASVCGLLGLNCDRSSQIADAMAGYDLSKRRENELPPNVTRNPPRATYLENYLTEDAAFHSLYTQPAREMGFVFDENPAGSRASLPASLVAGILEMKAHLLADASTLSSQQFLQRSKAGTCWLPYALQNFAGGHLMMHHFIQWLLESDKSWCPSRPTRTERARRVPAQAKTPAVEQPAHRIAIHTFDNGVRIYDHHLLDAQRARYLRRNVHEESEEDLFLLALKRTRCRGVFFDVGAGVGYYGFLAKLRRPDLSIHVAEPLPMQVERLTGC